MEEVRLELNAGGVVDEAFGIESLVEVVLIAQVLLPNDQFNSADVVASVMFIELYLLK